ncbi:MAG: hypothetical protein RJA07_2069 [Bacteroidota bacterium]|jgi:heme-degrading monooxygenase HmoA
MIIRIVKLSFKPEAISTFIEIFNQSQPLIKSFNGCIHVELLNDINNKNIFFTYSHWQTENDLNNYRQSDLFSEVWAKTKIHFNDKPEAWSVAQFV